MIYQPSSGEPVSLEIDGVDPDRHGDVLYRLRYRNSILIYTDGDRGDEHTGLFGGEELKADSSST